LKLHQTGNKKPDFCPNGLAFSIPPPALLLEKHVSNELCPIPKGELAEKKNQGVRTCKEKLHENRVRDKSRRKKNLDNKKNYRRKTHGG